MPDGFRVSRADEEIRKFDLLTHAVTVISEPHRINHDGFMYHASGKITGFLNGTSRDFLLVTAAANFPHVQRIRFDFGEGDVDIVTSEDAVASANGSSVTILNTNRNSANTPDLAIYTGPTITDVGTTIHTDWAPPTGTGFFSSGQGISNITAGEEWILEPSTTYLIRLTNNSGATISLRYEFLFYEIGYAT